MLLRQYRRQQKNEIRKVNQMKVLVINCGSSSLKYQLIDSETEVVLAGGICERIGIGGKLTHKKNGEKFISEEPMENHEKAMKLVLDALVDKERGVISHFDEIGAVGHRVVHGGEKFSSSVLVTPEIVEDIERCTELAPLHNPASLAGIRACQAILPNAPMAVVFDTAFHQTMEPKAYLYGLPYSFYEKYQIRKYGFHGTSHSFVSKRLCEIAGLELENSKVVVCHLGNGSSVTAVKNGKSIDTTMGLTPLGGLTMGTRSGDMDPAVVETLAHKENKSIEEIIGILNKESGVYGLSGGLSSDFRDLNDAADAGNVLAEQALQVFSYQVAKYIGAYAAAMNGLDAVAFTAGVGENDILVRKLVSGYLGYLGGKLDEERNNVKSDERMISTPDSKLKLYIIPTNEELAIARETVALL